MGPQLLVLSELTKKSGAREFESSLIEERKKSSALETQVTSLLSGYEIVSDQLRHLETRERELNEKCRDQVCVTVITRVHCNICHQERQLQLANGSIAELRNDLEDSQRRVRELGEQIQSDDRAEHLEESLKNTQDRADELEFQLSKLRQVRYTFFEANSG